MLGLLLVRIIFSLVDNDIVKKTRFRSICLSNAPGRSQHCPGIFYDQEQHDLNKLHGLPTNFLYIEDDYSELPVKVQNYKIGELEKAT